MSLLSCLSTHLHKEHQELVKKSLGPNRQSLTLMFIKLIFACSTPGDFREVVHNQKKNNSDAQMVL